MPQASSGYEEASIEISADPLGLIAALARSGIFDEYLVYEQAGCWIFAGGRLGGVTLGAGWVRSRWAGAAESTVPWTRSPARALRSALDAAPVDGWTAYGYLDFDFARVAGYARNPSAHPPSARFAEVMVPRTEVRIGPKRVVVRGVDGAELSQLCELIADPPQWFAAEQPATVDFRADATGYRSRVAQAVAEIREGRYQKVILSRTVPVPFPVDFVATYVAGRRANTPARSFLLSLGGLRAAGFSPEVLARVDARGLVTTEPLAGTRAFGLGAEIDAATRRELETDPKEVFEHAVSVRTAQQELSTVCVPGSVTVADFMAVKERGSVQHLGSSVSGVLTADRAAWDALDVLFPGVTASGIPKPEALDAIARLDENPRGLYAGTVFAAGQDGTLDAALVLRALYAEESRTWLRAGAGIVADSTPEREFEETCEKFGSVAPYLVRAEGNTLWTQ